MRCPECGADLTVVPPGRQWLKMRRPITELRPFAHPHRARRARLRVHRTIARPRRAAAETPPELWSRKAQYLGSEGSYRRARTPASGGALVPPSAPGRCSVRNEAPQPPGTRGLAPVTTRVLEQCHGPYHRLEITAGHCPEPPHSRPQPPAPARSTLRWCQHLGPADRALLHQSAGAAAASRLLLHRALLRLRLEVDFLPPASFGARTLSRVWGGVERRPPHPTPPAPGPPCSRAPSGGAARCRQVRVRARCRLHTTSEGGPAAALG